MGSHFWLRISRAVWLFLTFLATGAFADHSVPARVITKIGDIHRMSFEEAGKCVPVKVRGVITVHWQKTHDSFLQDATGAVYLDDKRNILPPTLLPGTDIEVTGVTDAGDYAPNLVVRAFRILGRAPLPAPHRPTIMEFGTGRLDSLYTEFEGIVRSVEYEAERDRVNFKLLTPMGMVWVGFVRCPLSEAKLLIGGRIRARGPLEVIRNDTGQLTAEWLIADWEHGLTVLEREQVHPMSDAPTSIANLLRFSSSHLAGTRVRARGTVTLVKPRKYLVLQDGLRGLKAEIDSDVSVTPGDLVDVIGFPSGGDYSPVLTNATAFVLRKGQFAEAVPMRAADAVSSANDFRLVRMKGELVAQLHDRDRQVIWLRDGDRSFAALLDEHEPKNRIDKLANGSELELTAVKVTIAAENRSFGGRKIPTGFRLYLRSDGDVRVLSAPAWWNSTRALEFIAGAFAAVGLVLIWNLFLRRKVKEQTSVIQRTAIFERQRNEILEMIGSHEELNVVLAKIQRLVERQIPDCECEITLGAGRLKELEATRDICWLTPILSAGEDLLGALAIETKTARTPGTRDSAVIETAARLAGNAIEHRQLFDRLTRQSQQDTLTGIANRFMLETRLRQTLTLAGRYGHQVACLFLDLDGFKQVNDKWGHDAGDFVLKQTAARLERSIRSSDILARMGGDEFCIVVPEIEHLAQAETLAMKLIETIEAAIPIGDENAYLSASVGISLFPENGETPELIQRCADAAMYEAKRAGKGRFVTFAPEQKLEIERVA